MIPLLEIKCLAKAFGGNRVFNAITLSLGAGRKVLLTGPSGCGKSTLLRLIAGLDFPDEGSICVEGQEVSSTRKVLVPPHQRRLAVVFQDLGLWPNLTAQENVLLGLAGQKLSKAVKLERVRDVLRTCGVEHLAAQRPARISGGEQQRVALARALAVRPQMLLLDEPFAGVDLITKNALLEQIHQLSVQLKIAVLLASHSPGDARLLGAEVVVVEDGSIIEQGSLESLSRNPRSRTLKAWQKDWLGHQPRIEAAKRNSSAIPLAVCSI